MKVANPVGKKGEDLAVKYLMNKGFKVIDRNFRIKNGEIDIIGIYPSTPSGNKGVLVFFEVKTRTSSQYGTPFEAVTSWKMEALVRTAQFYKISHKNLPEQMRIDAISVTLDTYDELSKIEQMENISGF